MCEAARAGLAFKHGHTDWKKPGFPGFFFFRHQLSSRYAAIASSSEIVEKFLQTASSGWMDSLGYSVRQKLVNDFPKEDTETVSCNELSTRPPTVIDCCVTERKPLDFNLPIAPTTAYLSVFGF